VIGTFFEADNMHDSDNSEMLAAAVFAAKSRGLFRSGLKAEWMAEYGIETSDEAETLEPEVETAKPAKPAKPSELKGTFRR
jgi:hypothetical protein